MDGITNIPVYAYVFEASSPSMPRLEAAELLVRAAKSAAHTLDAKAACAVVDEDDGSIWLLVAVKLKRVARPKGHIDSIFASLATMTTIEGWSHPPTFKTTQVLGGPHLKAIFGEGLPMEPYDCRVEPSADGAVEALGGPCGPHEWEGFVVKVLVYPTVTGAPYRGPPARVTAAKLKALASTLKCAKETEVVGCEAVDGTQRHYVYVATADKPRQAQLTKFCEMLPSLECIPRDHTIVAEKPSGVCGHFYTSLVQYGMGEKVPFPPCCDIVVTREVFGTSPSIANDALMEAFRREGVDEMLCAHACALEGEDFEQTPGAIFAKMIATVLNLDQVEAVMREAFARAQVPAIESAEEVAQRQAREAKEAQTRAKLAAMKAELAGLQQIIKCHEEAEKAAERERAAAAVAEEAEYRKLSARVFSGVDRQIEWEEETARLVQQLQEKYGEDSEEFAVEAFRVCAERDPEFAARWRRQLGMPAV